MERLEVWAERPEGFVHVGALTFGGDADERFEYEASYLQRDDACP